MIFGGTIINVLRDLKNNSFKQSLAAFLVIQSVFVSHLKGGKQKSSKFKIKVKVIILKVKVKVS